MSCNTTHSCVQYTIVYFKVVLLSTQVVSTVSLVSDGYLPEDGTGHVIAIQHLPDLDSVCAVTDKGDVILWNTVTDQARAFNLQVIIIIIIIIIIIMRSCG